MYALQTTDIDLFMDTSQNGVWPEANTLEAMLASREPETTSDPPNFTGLGDYRLATVSQRGVSWTATQFKLLGMDATDSYQPGMPVILADVQAVDEVAVRGAFTSAASTGYGTEVAVFLHQPGGSWHVRTSTADTGSALSSSSFKWFTRDSIEGAGPLAKWADIFVRGTAQWSEQPVPLQPSGTDQRGRLLFGNVRGRFRLGERDQVDALFSGSRINLNNWGAPEGLEMLTGNRMPLPYILPASYPEGRVTDHLDFLQTGWTHQMGSGSRLGALQLRYGYSATHLSGYPPGETVFGARESRVELSNGVVSEAAPMSNLAIRTRQGVEAAWQPGLVGRHQIVVGGGWKRSRPVNRITVPSDAILLTVNGAPADVLEVNGPLDTESVIGASSGYVADHIRLFEGLSADLGLLGDFSRGSLPAQSSGDGQFVRPRTFAAQPGLIAWNSISPRAGVAWSWKRLVVRGGYSRLYSPLAGRYLDYGNPNSLSGSEYQWIDRNGDGRFQLGEEGAVLMRFGGLYSSIAPSLRRPYADEYHAGAEIKVARASYLRVHLFRRDDKQRLAAIDTGVPASAFTPVSFQQMTVYRQDPATLAEDRYLLTNPAGLSARTTGWEAEFRTQWRAATLQASFMADKAEAPANPGNAAIENDPGVLGALFLDPNTSINTTGRTFNDRQYVAKVQATWQLPRRWGGLETSSIADYFGGIPLAGQMLVTGLPQGPFVVPLTARGDNGGYRSDAAMNWNLRVMREFRLPFGTLGAIADVLNVANGPQKSEVAIQEPRSARLQLRYEF